MPLIEVPNGSTPSGDDISAIGEQAVVTLSSAQMLGWSSPPAGAHVWNTDVNLRYIYDGSNWIADGGRRIGLKQRSNTASYTTGTDVLIDFDSVQEDTDSFHTSGTVATIPSFGNGVYAVTLNVVAGNVLGFGGGGGIIRIDRNTGTETFRQAVPASYDGTTVYPSVEATVSATFHCANSNTLRFYLGHSCGVAQNFEAFLHVWWTSQ